MSSKLLVIAALIAVIIPATVAQGDATNDTFNRANNTNLGPDWSVQTGSADIMSNQLQATGFQGDLGWAMHTTFVAPYDSQVIRADWSQNNAAFSRLIILAGASANWSGVSVKIGDNDGDSFADRIWFEASMNASVWFNQTSVWFNLSPQIAAGTATVWFTNSGDTVNVELIRASDGSIQNYSASGIVASPFAPTGTSVGLGYQGQVRIDNFQAWVGSPTAPAYTLTQPRVGYPATFLVTGATPNNDVVMVYSLTGGGPIFTALGPIGLDLPFYFLPTVTADASGTASLVAPPLPAALATVTIYTQVLDIGSISLSNYFAVWVL